MEILAKGIALAGCGIGAGLVVGVRPFLCFLNLAVIRLIQNFLICGLDC